MSEYSIVLDDSLRKPPGGIRYPQVVAGLFWVLFTLGSILFTPAKLCAQGNVVFCVKPSKTSFITGDTVLLAIEVKIRPYYYLYGNPVGPGGGRPLMVSIEQKHSAIKWLAIKKQKAEKIGPPFGDWVWGYRNEALFFCVGVVVLRNKNGTISTSGTIRIEGLVCRDACSLQTYMLPYSIDIAPRSYTAGQFVEDPDLLSKYHTSIPMIDFTATEP